MNSQRSLQRGRTDKTSQWRSLIADSLTVFWGDWLDLRVRIAQVAASGLVAPLIYILAFGLGLGSSLPQPAIGNSYLEFSQGRLSDRRLEFIKLHQYILTTLPTLFPPLRLCGSFPQEIPSTGTALKALEDKLDSLICAYVAAHWWYWGTERNIVLGDRTTDYIVVPQEVATNLPI